MHGYANRIEILANRFDWGNSELQAGECSCLVVQSRHAVTSFRVQTQSLTTMEFRVKRPGLWQSFGHAWDGIQYTLRTQRNARIHLLAGLFVAALAIWLGLDVVRCSILALTIGAVVVGEMANTALEALVDLVSPEYHERAKVAKDVAAGAVLVLGLMSVIVGIFLLGPPLWQQFFTP